MISAALINRDPGEVVWQSDHHRIYCSLTDVAGTVRTDHGPLRPISFLPDTVSFTPAGMHTRCDLPAAKSIQILQRPDTYENVISDIVRGGIVHLEPLAPTNDPLVSQIVSTLANEMKGGFLDRILADALNSALAVQITRHCVEQSAMTLAPSNGLSPERLRRVRDFIEAHLDDDHSLTVLADIACLSPYHFSRSFKESAGIGPQRYVMQRRLERAKTLLRRTHQPLALIAQKAGFADQSHLTSIFRREIGVTPGRFRSAMA